MSIILDRLSSGRPDTSVTRVEGAPAGGRIADNATFTTAFSGVMARRVSDSRSDAIEDLRELADPETYGDDEIPVAPDVLALGEAVVRATQDTTAATPEVVALDDGRLSLLWRLSDGLASIEIRDTRFGAVVRRSGSTQFLYNGPTDELLDCVSRGLNVYLRDLGVGRIGSSEATPICVTDTAQFLTNTFFTFGGNLATSVFAALKSSIACEETCAGRNTATGSHVDFAGI